MRPTELRRRLAALERRPAAACPDPWHQRRWTGPRAIDYRQAIRALAPPDVADVVADGEPADACPSCGELRSRVTVAAIAYPDYLRAHYDRDALARRLLTEEGADR